MSSRLRRGITYLRYSLFPRLLNAWPWLILRPLAVPLATLRWLVQPGPRRAAGIALRALGHPATRQARWRFSWLAAYHAEAMFLITLQSDKLNDASIARHVSCDSDPPPGGALLVSPHLAYARLGYWLLRARGYPVGLIAAEARQVRDPDHPDYASLVAAQGDRRAYYTNRWHFWQRLFGGHIFRSPEDTRAALRFLQAGGYLVIMPDSAANTAWEREDVLGRAMRIAPGPVWLARRAGKPLVPFAVVPHRRGWRVWLGAPVAPTQQGVATALSTCLRHAPTTLHGLRWLAWSRDPLWEQVVDEATQRETGEDARRTND